MSQRLKRRRFLRDVSLLSVGALEDCSVVWCPDGTSAREPIEREGGSHFKLSLAAYGYRDLLKAKPPTMTLEDFILECSRLGLDGTELTSYYFPAELTDDYLRRLKHLAFRLGLDISGTAVANDFCLPHGDDREQQLRHVEQWVDHAAVLGAPVIRIFSGAPGSDQSLDEAHRLAVEGIERCCEYAGQNGVFLALENHGGLTETADGMLGLVRDVKSPWFGVNLDTGNFYSEDIYADLARLAPYAVNVQVKVAVRPKRGDKQPTDFSRIASILRTAGYRGYVVLEYEEPEDPRTACPRYLEQLREALT